MHDLSELHEHLIGVRMRAEAEGASQTAEGLQQAIEMVAAWRRQHTSYPKLFREMVEARSLTGAANAWVTFLTYLRQDLLRETGADAGTVYRTLDELYDAAKGLRYQR